MVKNRRISRIGIAIAFLGILTACSGNKTLESSLAPDSNLNPLSSPTPSVESPTPGTTTLPDVFPANIPQYKGAELVSVAPTMSALQGQARWKSTDPSNLIESFYTQELPVNNWEIITPFSESNTSLVARQNDLEVIVTIAATSPSTEYTIDYRSLSADNTQPSPTPSITPTTPVTINTGGNFTDLTRLSPDTQKYIENLSALGVLSGNGNVFEGNKAISRRDFARWLVLANNRLFASTPGKQIRQGDKNATSAFSDVKPNDPDYAYIQGLAEAGLIPSSLSGDSSNLLFRPNAPLTREDLVVWKVPLDMRKALPAASIDTIKQTWGFQDANKIDSRALKALYGDFQNGDSANIRRVFGFTTLFQPKRPVTRTEAALALWYFGYQGDGINAADALQAANTTGTQQ
ncbi:MAG: hypothetical protein N5P05_000700 [Chroococcopsis gigantea SAG 12.99]|nr:S-layer homology domain-containing protein [Chlorogloea purpurea SAG 13.99]MDV2999094.1 hypothetical protein [Chroococcopsis gigantea SAG 12.99]